MAADPIIMMNPDLRRLADEGWDAAVVGGHVVLRDVPYVDAFRRVRRGALAVPLQLGGDWTRRPTTYTARWVGSMPCAASGRALTEIVWRESRTDVGQGVQAGYTLCARSRDGDPRDHYELLTLYAVLLSGHAAVLDADASARRAERVASGVGTRAASRHGFSTPPAASAACPFAYVETASARAGIGEATSRLAGHRLMIVGMGGTGGHVLDHLAKTPVARIHLVDDDVFEQHSAFRAPGAASRDDLAAGSAKVTHFDRIYSRMHRGIVPHVARLERATFHLLDHVDFIFLCVDDGRARKAIVSELERRDLPFVDTGIGLEMAPAGLVGAVRVTASLPGGRSHVRHRVPMAGGGADDVYRSNIQTSELNALAAVLAVIRWKKLMGFYVDRERELSTVFTVDGAHMLNMDRIGAVADRDAEGTRHG